MSVTGNWGAGMGHAEATVRGWFDTVNATGRTPQSLAHLRLGLQCGGSDAFSGVSANPLLGWLSRELVRYGGSPNLAETDELHRRRTLCAGKGARSGDPQKFLKMIERFSERAEWHGSSAAGNPSGGNKFRGLYNIILKSIWRGDEEAPRSEPRLRHRLGRTDQTQNRASTLWTAPATTSKASPGRLPANAI